jgi:hypothetical protein
VLCGGHLSAGYTEWADCRMSKFTKNQHYVAQLYLRQFASGGGKNPRVWAFDRSTALVTNPSIRNIASENYFYESTDTGVEAALSGIESDFADVYAQLRGIARLADLSVADRALTARFVALQMVRTAAHREMIEDIEDMIRGAVGQDLPGLPAAKRVHVTGMFNVAMGLAEIMLAMKWVRITNRTGMAYWTSDHPVNPYNPLPTPSTFESNLGLACRGIQVFFPLTPTLSLCLCDPKGYADTETDTVTDDPETVRFQNNLQLNHCTRFVLSPDADFALAKELLAAQPGLRDLTRPRMLSIEAWPKAR